MEFFQNVTTVLVQLISGFGLYTLLFLLINWFSKSDKLKAIDDSACTVARLLSVIYLICFLAWMLQAMASPAESDEHRIASRYFGPYALPYWFPVSCILLMQLLKLDNLRNSVFFRLILSLAIVLFQPRFFELYVIAVTSVQHEQISGVAAPSVGSVIALVLVNNIVLFSSLLAIWHIVKIKFFTKRS